jgi:hypothetical protein
MSIAEFWVHALDSLLKDKKKKDRISVKKMDRTAVDNLFNAALERILILEAKGEGEKK